MGGTLRRFFTGLRPSRESGCHGASEEASPRPAHLAAEVPPEQPLDSKRPQATETPETVPHSHEEQVTEVMPLTSLPDVPLLGVLSHLELADLAAVVQAFPEVVPLTRAHWSLWHGKSAKAKSADELAVLLAGSPPCDSLQLKVSSIDEPLDHCLVSFQQNKHLLIKCPNTGDRRQLVSILQRTVSLKKLMLWNMELQSTSLVEWPRITLPELHTAKLGYNYRPKTVGFAELVLQAHSGQLQVVHLDNAPPGVVDILREMKCLEELKVEKIDPRDESELAVAFRSWASPLRSLELLDFRDMETPRALGAGALAGLTHLKLLTWPWPPGDLMGDLGLVTVLRGLPHLRSLELHDVASPHCAADLLRRFPSAAIPALDSLCVTYLGSSETGYCLLPAAGCLVLRAPVQSLHVATGPCPFVAIGPCPFGDNRWRPLLVTARHSAGASESCPLCLKARSYATDPDRCLYVPLERSATVVQCADCGASERVI